MKLSLSNTASLTHVRYDWSPKGSVGGITLQTDAFAPKGE